MGSLRAVQIGGAPRVALAELRWLDDWHRHTRDEKDREYHQQQEAEREYMKAARAKARAARRAEKAEQRS